MDFSIGEDRQMLVDTLSRYLADKADWKAREAAIESDTGFDKAMWQGMAELGILGALFGEEVGGFGGSPFDIGVVFGEVGKALPPGPFLATLMAGKLLEAAGDAETLGNVIAGASIATFAHEPAVSADGSVAPQASASGSGDSWTVSGAKGVVDYLGSADVVVVTADTGNGLAAFLVETGASGVEIRDYPLVDGGAAGELTLSDAPARLLTDDASAIDTAIAAGLVATAWEAAAVMEVLRDETLAHYRSSPDVRRSFCARCGSTLFWDRDGAPHISICAGTLDLPSGLSTAGHIYVADKADFYEIDDGLPRFEGSSAGVLDGEASN